MNRSVDIIAHRGASGDAPENTMEAFQLGLEQAADAIECDVHLSSDNELVVIHDPDLQRTFGINKTIKSQTMTELKNLDKRIPSLKEVLELVPENRRIFIEVKVGMPSIVPLKKLLAASTLPFSQVVLMEFDLETVIAMKAAFPEAEVLWLNDFNPLSLAWYKNRTLRKNFETARQHGLSGVNLQNIPQLDREIIQACREHDLKCYCWTVDDPDRAAELIKGGIDGIATNRPGWIREQLNRSQKP
jgi:glycerophosphoryl diester phosphodiesterase